MAPARRLRTYLTRDEVAALLRSSKKSRHGARNHAMILLAYRHGLRASELVNLRWSDVDLERGTIYCRRAKGSPADAGYDLQLSGHAHGGQFWPWNLFVRLQQPFTTGLNRLGRMWVYTNRGTGYWGRPMRFGVPSEITLIRLVRG